MVLAGAPHPIMVVRSVREEVSLQAESTWQTSSTLCHPGGQASSQGLHSLQIHATPVLAVSEVLPVPLS